jgi:hypothetical protein
MCQNTTKRIYLQIYKLLCLHFSVYCVILRLNLSDGTIIHSTDKSKAIVKRVAEKQSVLMYP